MNWWMILAIVGGALAGLGVAFILAFACGVRPATEPERPGGGPHWRSDDGSGDGRYARDNGLRWNPAAVGAVALGLAALAGLAIGLALS